MSYAEVDIENNDNYFWYVCDDCHGEVKTGDIVCSHCQAILNWEGVILELCRKDGNKNGKNI